MLYLTPLYSHMLCNFVHVMIFYPWKAGWTIRIICWFISENITATQENPRTLDTSALLHYNSAQKLYAILCSDCCEIVLSRQRLWYYVNNGATVWSKVVVTGNVGLYWHLNMKTGLGCWDWGHTVWAFSSLVFEPICFVYFAKFCFRLYLINHHILNIISKVYDIFLLADILFFLTFEITASSCRSRNPPALYHRVVRVAGLW